MGLIGHREWDAQTYHEVSDPQVEWAHEILSQADLRGDERVLDAGCGGGRVTALLLDRVPDGHVVAVDASTRMLEQAREHLADHPERVTFHHADLTEIEVDEPVDFVFSNAVFHWIPDHGALFRRLAAASASGAHLLAQCGGEGNIARVREAADEVSRRPPFAEHFADFGHEWHFASPGDTRARLERAGYAQIEARLEQRPVRLRVGGPAERYLATVILRLHMARLPEQLHRPFAGAVAERLADEDGIVTLDYVRLNMSGVRE